MYYLTFRYNEDKSVLIAKCLICSEEASFSLVDGWEGGLSQFQRAHKPNPRAYIIPAVDLNPWQPQRAGLPSPVEIEAFIEKITGANMEKTSKPFTKKDARHAVSEAEAILTLALPVTRHERQGCHCPDCTVRFKEIYVKFCAEFESKE